MDFTNVEEDAKSMFTVLVGRRAKLVSEVLCLLSFVGAVVSYIVALVVAKKGRKTSEG